MSVVGAGLARTWDVVRRLPVTLLVLGVRGYQLTLSRLLGDVCRYYPSCSHYGIEALRTHGTVKGTALTVWRIARCNPFTRGGVDLVPARRDGSRAGRPLVLGHGPASSAHRRPADHPAAPVADPHDGRPVHPVTAA